MGPHHLDALFSPESIAVFGASEKEGCVGTRVFLNMIEAGYRGELYPVNPKYEKIHGRRCYKSLDDIDAAVDLVIIATPASTVLEIMRSCGEHGVSAAIVLSAGFREVGEQGARLEQALVDIARHY